MTKNIETVIMCVLVLLVIGLALVPLNYVDLLSQYTQSATAVEVSNCTVIDRPGVYVLTHDLSVAPGEYWCILINASNVVLDGRGHSIVGLGLEKQSMFGVFITAADNISINNLRITGFWSAIYLSRAFNSRIENNVMYNNVFGVVLATSSDNVLAINTIVNQGSAGIFLVSAYNNTIVGNTISDNLYGIVFFANVTGNTVAGNKFVNNGLLVGLQSYNNTVFNNTVNGKPLVYLENVRGVTIDYPVGQVIAIRSRGIVVRGVLIDNATVGIELYETNNSRIEGCTVRGNRVAGIMMVLSTENMIVNNLIENNGYGVGQVAGIVLVNSSNNIIYNNIFNNIQNVAVSNGVNYWNTSLSLDENVAGGNWIGGNYWASPDGSGYSQTCRDVEEPIGICDEPYAIDKNNVDYLPLTGPVQTIVLTPASTGPVTHTSTKTVTEGATQSMASATGISPDLETVLYTVVAAVTMVLMMMVVVARRHKEKE